MDYSGAPTRANVGHGLRVPVSVGAMETGRCRHYVFYFKSVVLLVYTSAGTGAVTGKRNRNDKKQVVTVFGSFLHLDVVK